MRSGRRSIGAVIAIAMVTAAGAGDAQSKRATPRVHGTNFFSKCGLSHAAPDDPIVHFGIPGGSHPHEFFGNASTNAYSTLETLRRHGTTCNRPADTAAYWVPLLYENGRAVKPLGVSVYYQLRSIGAVEPFPAGLKIVAGNAGAVTPQSTKIVFWNCSYPPGPARHVSAPPRCPPERRGMRRGPRGNDHLRLNIVFPDCWDGRRLDSPDHRSHMAYSSDLRCPASHPVKVPRLRLTVLYPIRGGPGLSLASGGPYSGHADFFNAWNQRALDRIVKRCSADERRCSR